MDRRRKGVSVPAFAFLCQVCGMSFEYIDDLQVHQMTDHASESEKDNDVSNPTPPRSFVPKHGIGPKDGSFQAYEPERIHQKLRVHLARSEETVVVPEIPRPLNPKSSNFFGDFRGIPGCNNSCYLDVFFMMIAFSPLFDGIYTQEALNSSVLLRIILFDVVIPLRTRMSVSRDVIAMIRQLMFQKTNRKDYLGDIFDLDEFLMHLCEDKNFDSICNFVNSSDIDGAIVCPLVLSIVSMDRKGVHASLQASILYTLNAKGTSLIHLPTAFFARVRPDNFDLPPLVLPQTHVYLETGTYIDGAHVVDNLLRSNYTLSAIVCIELSHYVVFLRLQDGKWFFFDSMRKIDSGHHVPTSIHVPNFQNYLESGCDESLLTLKSDASTGESRASFHERVTRHAYTYLFTAEVSKESERVGLPAEKPLLDTRRMWEASQQTANAHLHVKQLGQFSSQSFSAGSGAAAVLEQPDPSSRKPSADRAAVSRPQPPQKPSADRAAVSHPQPPQKHSTDRAAVSHPQPPQKPSADRAAVSHPQPPQKPSADRAAVSHPQPPQKPSADRAAVSRPQPPQKPSARGGEATVSHKPSGSFGHSQFTSASKSQSWMDRLQEIFQNLFIQHLNHTAVKSTGKYTPSPHDVANDLSFLSSIAFDVNNLRRLTSAFIYASCNVTLTDFTTRHNIVSSFWVSFLDGDTMVRVTAVVFEDGHVIAAYPELKDLQKDDPRREQLRNDFYRDIETYFQRFPRLVIDKVLIEPIKHYA
jgi:hypothetical protein